jgi:hypothetical protein
MNGTSVHVDHGVGGSWELALSDQREHVVCHTLEEASRVAYWFAADRRPCELVVRDAYHRVLRRELIKGGPGPRSRSAPRADRLP